MGHEKWIRKGHEIFVGILTYIINKGAHQESEGGKHYLFFLTRVSFCPIFFLPFSYLDLIIIRTRSHLKTKRLGRKIKKTKEKER